MASAGRQPPHPIEQRPEVGVSSRTSAPAVSSARIHNRVVTEALATLALTAYTVVVALGFARVFDGWDFAPTLVLIAVVAHATGALLRIARVPFVIALPLTIAIVTWTIGWIFYRDTYAFGLPSGDTWDRFQLDLSLVGDRFRTEVAPVPFLQGWDVLAAIGIGAVAILADTFAFRAYARAESLVPGGVLFVFISALGSDRARVAATVALVAAGVVATIALRVHHAPNNVPTIGRAPGNAARVAVPGALCAVVAIAAGAAWVGPRLPGADAEPLYDTTNRRGGVTTVVSPLVDIRSRLTNRSGTELFVMEADSAAYWRSSTLAAFNGQTWELPERPLQSAGDGLDVGVTGALEIRQRVTVSALGGALVPAAADPIAANPIDGDAARLRYNADSATLVQTGDGLQRGDSFQIVSAAPRFSTDVLRATTSTDAGDPIYLELPDDFPTLADELAREVTAGASTAYDRARVLQDWMRNEFDYSLEIQGGHGNNAIESFLINRVGYCEQFAGTYAAMMRSLGHPARVAVGFTPGLTDGGGRYSVLGQNAHAWPEVWFDGLGWVPFEPTPGRGAPGAEGYTGLAPEQDDTPPDPDGAGGVAEGDDNTSTPATPTTVPSPTTPEFTPGTTVPSDAIPDLSDLAPDGGTNVPVAAEPTTSESTSIPWRPLIIVLLLAAAASAPALVRRVRRRPSGTSAQQLGRLWERTLVALDSVGVASRRGDTPADVARRVAGDFPTAARPTEALAAVVTEATYGPAGDARLDDDGTYGLTVLGNCNVWTRQIEKTVTDSMSPPARLRRYITSWR